MKLRSKELVMDLRRRYAQGWTHQDVRQYLQTDRGLVVSVRSLKRWKHGLRDSSWLGPRVPTPPSRQKVSVEQVRRVCTLRGLTGWGSYPLRELFGCELSESTYKRIIRSNGLSRGSPMENVRVHWVKWEREHPDSLWQIDSFQLPDGTWMTSVIDDRSRFCFEIRQHTTLTTARIIALFEDIIAKYGKPREILSDNGAEHGSTSRNSQFDEWCRKHGIQHIRDKVHKPTTSGKIERFQQTVQKELPYCNNDIEMFRYRYNHIRPHMSLHGKPPADIYFSLQERIKASTKQEQRWW